MTKTQVTETKRGRGRPQSFPGQETVAFLANIPLETRNMVQAEAARREQPINVTLDALIRRAYKDANRGRKPAKATATEAA